MNTAPLPVIVIGAGPVGLAAAAHLAQRHLPFLVLEAGASVGASVRRWGHVRLFSPWRYNVDPAAVALLAPTGWTAPDGETYPTGADLLTAYLDPLAALPQIAPHLRLNTTVQAVTRQGFDKMKTVGREAVPFVVQVATADGAETTLLARAVIDASGTYTAPNPLGSSGVPAPGERTLADHIAYGLPDVLGADRARYAGRRVLVLGSGHSAFNALLDLAHLAEAVPGTQILWAIRRPTTATLYGGGSRDQLAERAALGGRIAALVDSGVVQLVTGFKVQALRATAAGVVVEGADGTTLPAVDTIIGATGFRPDLGFLRELRLGLDSIVESPTALAPLIDPNLHSCGTVPPHGVVELTHPEVEFYMVGMKSYGRAPTFLMLTGYEQVRSVVAALAGDRAAAEAVELVLPETGVCSIDRGASGENCCGGTPAATGAGGAPVKAARPVIALTPVGAGKSGCCG